MKGMGIKIKNNKLSDKWYRKIHRILSKMAAVRAEPALRCPIEAAAIAQLHPSNAGIRRTGYESVQREASLAPDSPLTPLYAMLDKEDDDEATATTRSEPPVPNRCQKITPTTNHSTQTAGSWTCARTRWSSTPRGCA